MPGSHVLHMDTSSEYLITTFCYDTQQRIAQQSDHIQETYEHLVQDIMSI